MKRSGEEVVVAGTEWPGTEWDTPYAWYKGIVRRETKKRVFVKFHGEDEEIEFTRESLQTYRELYDEFKMNMLIKAANM